MEVPECSRLLFFELCQIFSHSFNIKVNLQFSQHRSLVVNLYIFYMK